MSKFEKLVNLSIKEFNELQGSRKGLLSQTPPP